MTDREWKPGDVAAVTITSNVTHEANEYLAFYVGSHYGWQGVSDGKPCGGLTSNEDNFTITRRPLVVLDPEDREQARALLETWGRQYTSWTPELANNVTKFQVALREFANPTPPKPPEPTGLGAVVEVKSGERYVRLFGTPGYYVWRSEQDLDRGTRSRYDDLGVVRVLSEGVS